MTKQMKISSAEQDVAQAQNATMSQERAFLTKLFEAAREGHGDKVKEYVLDYSHQHQDVSTFEVLSQFKDGQRRSAIHFACMSDSQEEEEDIVLSLLTSSEKWQFDQKALEGVVRLKDKDGLTPLMLASRHTNKDIALKRVAFLLDKAGNKLALARSHAGATALHYAAGAGASRATIERLVEAGKVALRTNSKQGGSPLHWAAAAHGATSRETLQALLDCNADINALNDQGMPPVVLSAAAGNDVYSKMLIQAGAKFDMELPGGVSLFHMAADLNMVGTLAAMLEKSDAQYLDRQLNKRNDQGETPLDLCAQEGHVGCVMLLLPNGENSEEEAKKYIENHKANHKPQEMKPVIAEKSEAKNASHEDEIEACGRQRAEKIQSVAQSLSAEEQEKALEIKNKGNTLFAKKEYESAIEQYSLAMNADPANAALYSNRSACYMALDQYTKALEDAVTCLHLNPTWPKAFYRVAIARFELGRYEDAAVAAWEGLQKDTSNDELKRLLQKSVKQGKKEHQALRKGDKSKGTEDES